MPTQIEKATSFRAAHKPGDPVVLVNVWDAGSASIVDAAGAKALATGSYSVAEALGFEDGENCPLEAAINVLTRICAVTQLPVSYDLERGYGDTPEQVAASCARVVAAGAVGINIEDSLASGALRDVGEQAERIATAAAAMTRDVPEAVVNARCDAFFADESSDPARALNIALERGARYADSGATSLFVPGLSDVTLIKRLCQQSSLPVNVMCAMGQNVSALKAAGAARISYGPHPWRAAMAALRSAAEGVYASH